MDTKEEVIVDPESFSLTRFIGDYINQKHKEIYMHDGTIQRAFYFLGKWTIYLLIFKFIFRPIFYFVFRFDDVKRIEQVRFSQKFKANNLFLSGIFRQSKY